MQSQNCSLYEAALKPKRGIVSRVLYASWVVLGLSALIAFAWAEPWSAQGLAYLEANGLPHWLTAWVGASLVMILRAVVLVEAVGYVYHRFFQHVGFFTRRAQVFRRNQRFHWIHHMIIYPIGRFYQRAQAYVASEKGLGLSWFLPALITVVLFIAWHGIGISSLAFVAALGIYAKFVVDRAHSRFHEINHPWANSRYFHWLEDIHVLHHWDQRTNFTIVHPLMDQLFGTYLSPKTHQKELKSAMSDDELTVSDIINWRYLLLEATPAEYAAFISAAKQHRRSLRKMDRLMAVLQDRIAQNPEDAEARELQTRATDLLALCAKPGK